MVSKVELNKSSGKWCLDATGTCLQGGLFDSPAAQDTWQANPVSNFDGDCVKGQVTQPLPFQKGAAQFTSGNCVFRRREGN